jgi:aldehyde dehydrogenase (NAD(P)+)
METQPQTTGAPTPPQSLLTARPEIDQGLEKLKAAAGDFVKLGIPERLQLLRRMIDGYVAVAEDSVRAGLEMKGISPSTSLAAEEWLAGPVVVIRNLRLLIDTLQRLQDGLPPFDPARIRTQTNGRMAVDVFPTAGLDKVMFGGFRAEVRMKEGVSIDDVMKRAAIHYKTPAADRKGGVALVLGAGNVASIPPTDVLYKMFVEGKVCVLKMNPVNAHVGPFIEKAWSHLVDAGYLTVVYGGPDVGAYLVDHPIVEEIHITGSDKTHDMMVWGPPGAEREERKRNKKPKLAKPITSELGNVSPVIVVPGPYTDKEIEFQGQSICAAIANNASFNCNSAKLLIAPKGSALRGALRQSLKNALQAVPLRKAYYPGAEDRWKLLVDSHPTSEKIGDAKPGELPWALIPDLDAENAAEKAFEMEPWCSVISETAVGSEDPVKFLEDAVKFANDRVWGTLSATIIIHPKTAKDPRVAPALEKAINELRYGTVCINHWPALGFAFGSTPWGGHPSATLENIQSGKGWVHNTFLLNDDDIEKCVIYGPLVAKPKPVWFAGHKTAAEIGKKMVAMEAAPSIWKLPGVILAALKG